MQLKVKNRQMDKKKQEVELEILFSRFLFRKDKKRRKLKSLLCMLKYVSDLIKKYNKSLH
jgi:hypothetical protein